MAGLATNLAPSYTRPGQGMKGSCWDMWQLPYFGVSNNHMALFWTQSSRAVTIRTPTKSTPDLCKQPYYHPAGGLRVSRVRLMQGVLFLLFIGSFKVSSVRRNSIEYRSSSRTDFEIMLGNH